MSSKLLNMEYLKERRHWLVIKGKPIKKPETEVSERMLDVIWMEEELLQDDKKKCQ